MLNVIKRKIKNLVLISTFIASPHAAADFNDFGENDFLQGSIQSAGWVKVRVWQEGSYFDARKKETKWGPGHVSLETVDSYCSLWPTTPPEDAHIWSSPAGLIKEYSTDFSLEGNRSPSHVFLLYLEESGTTAIKAMKEHYINRYKAKEQKRPVFVDELTNSVMWYSKGGPKPVDRSVLLTTNVVIDDEKQYYNCASFVAVALAVADPKFLVMYSKHYSKEKYDMIKACHDSYLTDSAPVRQQGKIKAELEGVFADIAAYFNNLFMPSDIVKILQDMDKGKVKILPDGKTTETESNLVTILSRTNIISNLPFGSPLGVQDLVKLYDGNQKQFWNKLGKLTFVDGQLQLGIEHECGIYKVKKMKQSWCALM